jgi:hypothetical protein
VPEHIDKVVGGRGEAERVFFSMLIVLRSFLLQFDGLSREYASKMNDIHGYPLQFTIDHLQLLITLLIFGICSTNQLTD